MTEALTTPEFPDEGPAAVRRISWGAVFAGGLAVLAVQLVLSILGLSIGASTIEPLQEQAPFQGIGLGAGLWLVITGIISLFVGGWVAGHLAGIPRRMDAALHGLLSWGLATLAAAFLVTSAAGSLISGATGMVGRGVAALGHGAAGVAQQGVQQLQDQGVDLSTLKSQALALLRDTGKPELQPGNLGAAGERAQRDAQATAEAVAKNPQAAGAEISALIDRIFANEGQALSATDREAAVNLLVNRTNMSRPEAQQTVANWEQTIRSAQARYTQLKAQTEEKARAAGDKVAGAVAKAAGWAVFALVLGAVAAGFGGLMGAPRRLIRTTEFA